MPYSGRRIGRIVCEGALANVARAVIDRAETETFVDSLGRGLGLDFERGPAVSKCLRMGDEMGDEG